MVTNCQTEVLFRHHRKLAGQAKSRG